MSSESRRRAEGESLRAKLDTARSERDLMKAVAEELHLKVLALETELADRDTPAQDDAAISATPMPADRVDPPAELSEAQARADRLAARVAELRLQLSIFAPESKEEVARAGEAIEKARRTSERTQTLERQLANARAREDQLISENVRYESRITDLEARVLELSALEARANEAAAASAEAEQHVSELQVEVYTARVEAQRLRRERDEARDRAEAERLLASADRLRADEAQRMVEGLQARSGDVQGALGRIAELEAELSRVLSLAEHSASQREQELAAPDRHAAEAEGPELAALREERDAIRQALETAHVRLDALEEVAAHAADLEIEVTDARVRLPEMRSSADAAAQRAAELFEAIQVAEAERDAAREALQGRIGDVQELRARIRELEASSGAEESTGTWAVEAPPAEAEVAEIGVAKDPAEPALANLWLADGVAGSVEIVDLNVVSGPDFVGEAAAEPFDPAETTSQVDTPTEGQRREPSGAGAGSGRLRRRGRYGSGKKPQPEDPSSWT